MTTISIIGSGNMATAIGTRAAQHGHTVELLSRNTAKAQALADQIGNGTTVGRFGAKPAGEIVIVAVLYTGVVEAVANYGDALAGKILVDISNPFNADASGLVTPSSAAQEMADAAPKNAHVVKALNTIFGHVLAKGTPLDTFIAGDSDEAKAAVAVFLESLELRTLDTGGLQAASDPRVGQPSTDGTGTQRRRLRPRPGRRGPLKAVLGLGRTPHSAAQTWKAARGTDRRGASPRKCVTPRVGHPDQRCACVPAASGEIPVGIGQRNGVRIVGILPIDPLSGEAQVRRTRASPRCVDADQQSTPAVE